MVDTDATDLMTRILDGDNLNKAYRKVVGNFSLLDRYLEIRKV